MKTFFTYILFFASFYTFSSEMSFNDAFKAMLVRNTDIPGAKATLEAASTVNLSSKLLFLPTLALEKNRTQDYTNDVKRDDLTLTSTLNLFRFGADWHKAKAASYSEQSQTWNKLLTEFGAETEAATILLEYISQGLLLGALREFAQVKQQALKVAQLRSTRGMLSIQESQKAEIDLGNAEAQLQNSELDFIKAKSRLDVSLGNSNIKISWPWTEFVNNSKHQSIVTAKFDIEKCPQYNKQQLELEAAQSNLSKAKSSILPSLDLSYSYSSVDEGGSNFKEQVGLLKLSMPIFNGLSDYASMSEQRALTVITANNLEKSFRELTSLWQERSNELLINSKNALRGQQAIRLARSLYNDSFRRFEQGRSSVNDLLLDQSRLLDSETLAINSWYKTHLALLEVCHLSGLSIFECL